MLSVIDGEVLMCYVLWRGSNVLGEVLMCYVL